eukprot:TRINITY_DN7049_c0_g1_i3.p1 TRINITY_DN7049_c0_g1~~TRINITY_DN7049_c0_g1_i3.p1  ORF type:complete len:642 (-),score=54.16 TRINITY_DN7049_c0_g1_i3:802-2727(-)
MAVKCWQAMEQSSFEELPHDRKVRAAAAGSVQDVVSCSSNHLSAELSRTTSSFVTPFGAESSLKSDGVQRGSGSSVPQYASIIPHATNLDGRESQALSRLSSGFWIKMSKLGHTCSMASSRSYFLGLRPEYITVESRSSSHSDEMEVEVELNVVPVHKVKKGWKRQMSAESLYSRKQSLVWSPQSICRRCIEGAEFIVLLFESCWIPVQIAFNPYWGSVSSEIEYVLTVFWTVDVCLSFNCGYVDHLGDVVMDRRLIALKYLKTWFFIDFAAVLSNWIFMVIGNASGQQRSAWVGQVLSVLRAMRLLRLQKLYRVLRAFEQRLNSSFALMVFHSWKLFLALGYFIHLQACVWYLIGTSSTDGWVHGHNFAHRSKLQLYAIALFFSMTYFSGVKFVDLQTTAEVTFCSLVGFYGGFWSFLTCFGSVMNMMHSHSRMQQRQQSAARFLNEYLELHSISVDLSVRAKTCLKSRSSGYEEQFKLDDIGLPKQIMADIEEEANRPFLLGHPLFTSIFKIHARSLRYVCNEACMQKSYVPGEDVFVTDASCDAMIIQTAGRTTYSYIGDGDNNVVETVREGEWLAEVCLWAVWAFRGNLKTESNVSTVEVSVSGFLAMVRTFAPYFSSGFFSRYAQTFLETLGQVMT